ncbi:hypothetical protein TNCV_3979741 [Trichonephila clavipes]|nr:hypothetical protein TNCV_3979741 [Trichonephila clavipes]
MDQHSRWPEAIPLKSLTAKSTWEALLEIFSRTGIPEVIVMDNATNFTASLTHLFFTSRFMNLVGKELPLILAQRTQRTC